MPKRLSTEIEPLCKDLGKRATLQLFRDADHSFHVPARSGRKDADIRREMAETLEDAAAGDGVAPVVCGTLRRGDGGPGRLLVACGGIEVFDSDAKLSCKVADEC